MKSSQIKDVQLRVSFLGYLQLLFLLFCLPLFSYKAPLSYREPFVPYSKECLILPSPGENSGLFSVFTTVLGFLDFYDQKKCQGIRLDFGEKGLYFESQKGPNWWNYYFEPIVFGNQDGIQEFANEMLIHRFTKKGFNELTREEAYKLIKKYIKVKSDIQQKVDAFVSMHFKALNLIGIHYRGTDKKSEAVRVSYEKVFKTLDQVIQHLSNNDYKIFIATDEKQFVKEMTKRYGGRVIFTSATRTIGKEGVHMIYKNNYRIGEEAIIDCLLLSKCNLLIRTASNLSTCVSYFNPYLPMIELNQLKVERSFGE